MKKIYENKKTKGYWTDLEELGFTTREKVDFSLVLEKMKFVGFDINIEIPSIEILLKEIESIKSSKTSFIFITGQVGNKITTERLFFEYYSIGGDRGHKVVYKEYPGSVYSWAQDIIGFTYNKTPVK